MVDAVILSRVTALQGGNITGRSSCSVALVPALAPNFGRYAFAPQQVRYHRALEGPGLPRWQLGQPLVEFRLRQRLVAPTHPVIGVLSLVAAMAMFF